MTCKDALKKQYPKWSDELVDTVVHRECPSGYFDIDDPIPCNRSKCDSCWDREVPGTLFDPKTIGLDPVKDEPLDKSGILDSGATTEFETGAHRDAREGMGRCDLLPLEVVANYICDDNDSTDWILRNLREFQKDNCTCHLYSALKAFGEQCWEDPYTMLLEVSKHYEGGAIKYGPDNWKKGMPVYIYIDSAVRHYLKWLRGDTDEPHDRAFCWNLMCCIWEVDYHKEDQK